jgi:large subunit ribosomal protein L29
MTKPAELRELTIDELAARERELDDRVFRQRLQKSMGQLDSSASLRANRKDLARVKTIRREKVRAQKQEANTGR